MNTPDQPFFSVITPTCNREALIGRAVQSVVDQTCTDWEMIVVDDASTDGTAEILCGCTDHRIRVLTNARNLERSASRNLAITEARARYICFLDSDDYYLPEHLETMSARIAETEGKSAMVLSCRREFAENSVDVRTASRRDPSLTEVEQIIRHHIPVNTLAVPRKTLPDPAFDTRFRINEDVHLFARLAACGLPFHCFDDVTSVWSCEGQNTKNQVGDYITPQIHCMRDLFTRPEIRAATRPAFRRQHLGGLWAQLAHGRCEHGERCRALLAAVRAFSLLRGDRTARSALGHVLYSLPGGSLCRRIKSHLGAHINPQTGST